jgi:hypothetical protein
MVGVGGGSAGTGGWERERAMRPLRVVVVDEHAQNALEVSAVEDQQPVKTFGADSSDETFGDGGCLRRPYGRLDDPHATAAEHLVEGASVLAVAVADQEAHAVVGEVEAEVARLLGDPGPGGVSRAAGEPDAAVCVCDEEEDVVAAQEHAVDGEEVAGTMLAAWVRRNSRQPGPESRGAGPTLARASSLRIVVGDTRKPSLASSPLIRRWPQRGFSRASRSTAARTSDAVDGRPRRPGGWRHLRRTSARCQRNSVRGVTRRAPREERGRWKAAAARRARSGARSFGRAAWRPGGAEPPARGAGPAARCP